MKSPLALAIAAASVAASFSAQAEQTVQLDTITIVGDRFETPIEQQLTIINTIEREEIEALAPKSVIDVLETLPGISVVRTGGATQSASLSMRGTASYHTLVLIDGIRVGSATTGAVAFGALAPEHIERIEVLQGARAVIWGSDAIGGVIHITTRKMQDGEGVISTEFGSHEYYRGSVGTGFKHGDGQSTVAINYEQSEGFDVHGQVEGENDDDGYERLNLLLSGQQQLTDSFRLTWLGQYDEGESEYDSTFSPGGNNAYDFKNYLVDLGLAYQHAGFSSYFNLNQSQDQTKNYRNDIPDPEKSLTETQRDQLTWSNQYLWSDSVTLIGGVDWYREKVDGNYDIDQRDVWGVYGLARWQNEQWLAEGAVRYNGVEHLEDENETVYNLGLGYQLNDTWRVALSTATAYKLPTFNFLYFGSEQYRNPDLESETSQNYELMLNFDGQYASGYFSSFHTEFDNYIISTAETGYRPENLAKVRIQGGEFLGRVELTDALYYQVGYTYLDAMDETTNKTLPNQSRHAANLQLGYQWQTLNALVNYHYQGTRVGKSDNRISANNRVDLSMTHQATEALKLQINLHNIFDEDTRSDPSYQTTGRELYLSMSYNF